MEELMNTLFKSLLLSLTLISCASKGMEMPNQLQLDINELEDQLIELNNRVSEIERRRRGDIEYRLMALGIRALQDLKEYAEKYDFDRVEAIVQSAPSTLSKILVLDGYWDRLLILMFEKADTPRINSILKSILESRDFTQEHKNLIAQRALDYALLYNKETTAKYLIDWQTSRPASNPVVTANDYLSAEDAEEWIKALAISANPIANPITSPIPATPTVDAAAECPVCREHPTDLASTQILKTNCCSNFICVDDYNKRGSYHNRCPMCLRPSSAFTVVPARVKPAAPTITSPKPAAAPKAKPAPALPAVKANDKCMICLEDAKDIHKDNILKTKCCGNFICKDDAQRLQDDAKKLQDPAQRAIIGARDDFTGWTTADACPTCKRKFEVEKAMIG